MSLIYEIKAIVINEKDYKIVKGKKALLNATTVTGARSVIECATKCGNSNGCIQANFKNSKCEFLKNDSPGIEIHFEEDAGSKYICKCLCSHRNNLPLQCVKGDHKTLVNCL